MPATQTISPTTANDANAAALFHPYRPADADGTTAYPCIEVAGVQVYVYVHDEDDHALRVSLHYDEAAPPLVLGPDDCVPVKIVASGGGDLTWIADRDGTIAYPALAAEAQALTTAARAVAELDWPGMAPDLARALGALIRSAETAATAITGVGQ